MLYHLKPAKTAQYSLLACLLCLVASNQAAAQTVANVINQSGTQIDKVPKLIIAISFTFGITMVLMGGKNFADYAKDAGRNKWQSALAKMCMGAAIILLPSIYNWAGKSFIKNFDPNNVGTVKPAALDVFDKR